MTVKGRQLKVYLHPQDRPAVDAFVQRELASALLSERSRDRGGFEVQDSQAGGMGRLICPRPMVPDLNPRYIEARDEWILDVQVDPLIEWWFSRLDDDQLYPGRFYYLPSVSASNSKANKPAEFLAMATRLLGWVREETVVFDTEWGSERLGPVAAEMLQGGRISLRRNPPGSRM
ncbi:hypothetical protein GCM10022251_76220 [Phytohabitans flavus]|uniref:Uncharacterized protein n=1 Tax=Phytohabitans flavus TaxID=1076124 RepID=A0A6F8XT56_9ACTN|nr:hypothetical protein Pflav_033410 [Phytohabitans flavus]